MGEILLGYPLFMYEDTTSSVDAYFFGSKQQTFKC